MNSERILATSLALTFFVLPFGGARADTTVNFLLASEFGGGLGAGLEIGADSRFVFGVGAPFGIGGSESIDTVVFHPGLAVGYRRYFSDWYFGPSVSVNSTVYAMHGDWGEDSFKYLDSISSTTIFEFGYRFVWNRNSDWSTKIGFGSGFDYWPGEEVHPAIGFTASLGKRVKK